MPPVVKIVRSNQGASTVAVVGNPRIGQAPLLTSQAAARLAPMRVFRGVFPSKHLRMECVHGSGKPSLGYRIFTSFPGFYTNINSIMKSGDGTGRTVSVRLFPPLK